MDSHTCLTKFTIKNKNLYVKLYWKENEYDLFQIKIFDGDISWSGRFSCEFATKYMRSVVEDEEEYRKNVRNALTGESNEYIYDFSPVPGDTVSATFSWKKKYENLAVRVHGSVPVHQDDTPHSKDILIDYLLKENQELRQTVKELQDRNNTLNTDLEECKLKLEQFIDIKTSLETSLYGKFVMLLNTKKKRIQLLEENMKKYEQEENNSTELD